MLRTLAAGAALVLLAQAAAAAAAEHGHRCRRGQQWCEGACRAPSFFWANRGHCGKASVRHAWSGSAASIVL